MYLLYNELARKKLANSKFTPSLASQSIPKLSDLFLNSLLNKPPAVAKASEDLRIEVKYQSNLEIAGFLLKFCKKHP